MIVADTDVLIDYLAGRRPASEAVAAAIESDQLVTTTVNSFELLAGARSAGERKAVSELLENISLLSLDPSAARRAAEVRRHLENKGLGIGMGDSLIAGIALANGARLLTRNKRHFDRVPGLEVASPVD